MDKMKKILKYVIWVLLFYVFSNIMINAFLKVSYNDISDYSIDVEKPFIEITEAKASNRNGEIYGIIKNDTNNVIENKYIKVSMLSKNNNVLGEKYVKIDRLEVQQLKKFEVRFEYKDVKSFKVEITDSKPEDVDFLELVKTNINDLVKK